MRTTQPASRSAIALMFTCFSLACSDVSAPPKVVPATPPNIVSVAPERVVRGSSLTITGSGFSPVASANVLTLDGVPLTVTAATGTQLTATVPVAGNFSCSSYHPATLNLRVSSRDATHTVTFSSASQVSLAPGQALIFDAASARCAEIPQQNGEYFLAVFNTSTDADNSASFKLAGQGGASANVQSNFAQRAFHQNDPAARRAAQHARILGLSERVVHDLGRPPRINPSVARYGALAVPNVGDMVRLNFPDVSKPTTGQLCASVIPVTTRVVYSGPKVVVLEDVTNATARTVDAHYKAMVAEYESRQLSILESNFGNPFAFDSQLSNTRRIFMVFTHLVTDNLPDALGFVISSDMYARSSCASSNVGEFFYAQPPASNASSDIKDWSWQLPALAIHETYHIVNDAEHFARSGASEEEGWLNESLAQIAIEIWARQVYGYAARQNVGYAASARCENFCVGKPMAVTHPLQYLNDYLMATEVESMLTDHSAYGAGWMFVRWALDQFAANEASALKAMTQETNLTGISNLTARTGKSFSYMLPRFALALAADDRVLTPYPELAIPSWNLRDIYAGLNRDLPDTFWEEFPLLPFTAKFGTFDIDLDMPGGTMMYLSLSGSGPLTQLIGLLGTSGGAVSSNLGLAIIRVQ